MLASPQENNKFLLGILFIPYKLPQCQIAKRLWVYQQTQTMTVCKTYT
jgi:hypothetical protein